MRIMGYTSLQCPDWEHHVIIACAADFLSSHEAELPKAITTEVAYNAYYDTVHPMWVHDTCTMIPTVLPSALPKGTHVWFIGSTTISSSPEGETWLVGKPGDTIKVQRPDEIHEFEFGQSSLLVRNYYYGSLSSSYKFDYFYRNAWQLSFPTESILEPDYGSIPGMDYVNSLARFEERWDPQALTAKALDQYQGLSINTASYIKELPTVISTLTETVRSVKAAMHGDIKQLASAYLGNKYGTQNTIRDTVDIIKYINGSQKTCRDSLHGSASFSKKCGSLYNVTVRDGCTIRVNPVSRNVFDSTIDALRQIDLLPSLENFWDSVPYSFVIDWMVPIGDILSGIDKSADLARLDVRDCFYSRLIEFQSSAPWGVCRRTHFARYSSPPVSPIGVDSYSSGNISNHFLETTALIVQRTK